MKLFAPNQASRTPKGDNYVWLTSAGLGLGIIMIVGLLSLIVYRGLEVFWPDKVALVTTVNEDHAKFAGQLKISRAKKNAEAGQTIIHEKQFYLANRDVFGESFLFLDESQIQEISYPIDILFIERLEYGPAIGFAKSLTLNDGTTISADQANFQQVLGGLVAESRTRWEKINQLEKDEIGAINKKMEDIRLQKNTLLEVTDNLLARETALQTKYENLAEQAQKLRQEQIQSNFTLILADGRENSFAVGQILHFYYPNQLSIYGSVKQFFREAWVFLSTEPREANTEGGIFPALFGTFMMTIMMSLLVTPLGVLAAIYLREYAKQGFFLRLVRIAVNNLAGVPSIVFGVFGLGFFVYFVGGSLDELLFGSRLPTPTFGTGGILWASLTLALLTLPVVIVASEEALSSVSAGMREASLACGASKWQTISRIVLPSAAPGILTGMILAMARGAGEVAPLMLVGVVKLAPSLPLNGIFPYLHLDQKFMHLGFHIYDLGFQSPDSEAAIPMVFATTLLLIVMVFIMNIGAILVRERLRRKYATKGF